ncbi:hypothetical protein IWQ56_000778 [Coemansia nantahalensis]|nr:hypothetical protein IWQ56_000778 [Coemansia nantahalensis]
MAEPQEPMPATAGVLRPPRSVGDEIRELQAIVGLFQDQLGAPGGVVNLHPLGAANVEKAQVAFGQACARLRAGLASYRDTTLASWAGLMAAGGEPAAAASYRAATAMRELSEMRRTTDVVHEDMAACQALLFDAAGDAVSRTLGDGRAGSARLLIERLAASAKRLGLAHYTDVQPGRDGGEVTTVTLAGSVSVVDVDIGANADELKVKVSYVLDMEHDSRIDALMLRRLRAGDVRGFERLLGEMAALDKLTVAHPAASFIRSTFAVAATLAEIQRQELAALDGDLVELARSGSGVALPFMRHAGPATMYYLPAAVRYGLTAEQWGSLGSNTLEDAAELPGARWLSFAWEPSSTEHFFLPETCPRHCVDAEYMADSASGVRVVASPHPAIRGLEMRFLEPTHPRKQQQQEQPDDASDQLWLRYAAVARLEPELPACAMTVRGIVAVVSASAADGEAPDQAAEPPSVGTLDSPRLLDDAPTLEQLVRASCAPVPDAGAPFKATHSVGRHAFTVELDSPQIRGWSISRVPLASMRNVPAVVSLLRRQAIFNELVASCFSATGTSLSASGAAAEPVLAVAVKTHAGDPFRIDLCVRGAADDGAGQGVVLRVDETRSGISAWTHQALGVAGGSDILAALAAVSPAALTADAAHPKLSRVASIGVSIPTLVHWLTSYPDRL